MSNYFWSANGKYIKKNIIESYVDSNNNTSNNGFSFSNSTLCIDDICLSKDELYKLKDTISNISILDIIKDKDKLTPTQIINYLKFIFNEIHNSTDNEKINNISKYLAYSMVDKRTNKSFLLNTEYAKIDFYNFILGLDDIEIKTFKINESKIKSIISNNIISEELWPNNPERRIKLVNSDIQNISVYLHMFVLNSKGFYLVKVYSIEPKWILIILDNNLLLDQVEKMKQDYNTVYKNNLDIIKLTNQKDEINPVEFKTYIDNLKEISIENGEFKNDIFIDNLFIKKYIGMLNLSSITDDFFDNNIYSSVKFEKNLFDDILEEKSRLGFYKLSENYYLLDETDSYYIKLIHGMKNMSEIDNFKWQILFFLK